MLIRSFQPCLLLASTLGIAACGTGEFTAGHDPDATIDSLTDQQAVDLCVALFDHYDSVHGDDATVRTICRATGLRESDEAACGERFDTCVASTAMDVRAACERNITAARENCPATVAEIEACGDATAERYADVLALSCAEAPRDDTFELTASPEPCASLPGSCNALVLQTGR